MTANLGQYDADPMEGNFTADAEAHVWQAESLSVLLSVTEVRDHLGSLNNDICDGVFWLLRSELERARQALAFESAARLAAKGVTP